LSLCGVGSAFTADADSFNAGQIQLSNGTTLAITGNLDNSGTLDLENASVLTVTGDVNNSGTLGVSFNGGGTGGSFGCGRLFLADPR